MILTNNEDICGGCLVMEAERVAKDVLYQYSLKACYYDNNITIELKKNLFSSWIEFKFPIEYVRRQCANRDDVYSAINTNHSNVNDIESNLKPRTSNSNNGSNTHPHTLHHGHGNKVK